MRLAVLFLLAFTPLMAQAASDTPLIVVRYNQPKVYYQRQLYNAISRAVAIKPSVRFEIVSFNPASADEDRLSQQTEAFVRDLNGMGIPGDRISRRDQEVTDSATHEIYLYVD